MAQKNYLTNEIEQIIISLGVSIIHKDIINDTHIIELVKGDSKVGDVQFSITESTTNTGVSHIKWISIEPEYQGHGYGILLLMYTIQHIFNTYRTVNKIKLDDMSDKAGTPESIYKKLGFVMESRLRRKPKERNNMTNNEPEMILYRHAEWNRKPYQSRHPRQIPGWNQYKENEYIELIKKMKNRANSRLSTPTLKRKLSRTSERKSSRKTSRSRT